MIVLFAVGCSRKKETLVKYPGLEAGVFLDKINQTVELKDNEIIDMEKTGWIEQDICYRVAVQRSENIEGEYGHLRDYVYTKSFEEIPNYSVNNEESCIWGRNKNTIYKYKFENDEFVLYDELNN